MRRDMRRWRRRVGRARRFLRGQNGRRRCWSLRGGWVEVRRRKFSTLLAGSFAGGGVGGGTFGFEGAEFVVEAVLKAGTLGGQLCGFAETRRHDDPVAADDFFGFAEGTVCDGAGSEAGFGDDRDVGAEA